MRKILALVVFCSSILAVTAQERDNRVLMTIADNEISVDEFLAIYNKNNTNNVVDKKSVEEYVDLFVNFKLKVVEAESMGMDTVSKFVKELAGYRRQLAQPYLVDKEMTEKLITEAYERMKVDVKAYHVLIRVSENAPPADTLAALKKLQSLTSKVSSEADMLGLIERVQNDTDKGTIGEDLGYFTAFSMVYPFETMAYNTEIGTLSNPVRTRFGYHAIFVTDRREARGEVRVSHIMTKTGEVKGEERELAEDKINEIYERLQNGENFNALAKQYSEDRGTSNKGGLLPWFGTGRMVPAFENAAFSLKTVGEYSKPVQTQYGWHIIRKEDQKGIGTLDDVRPTIKKKIERDTRSNKGRESLIAKLKKEYSVTYNYKNRDAVNALVNDDFKSGKWNPEAVKNGDDPVITITDSKYSKSTIKFTKQDYLDYLKQNQPRKAQDKLLSNVLMESWKTFDEESLIAFEDQNLEAKYPAFKALMQEYHDGILLFDLMDKRVWSKAVKDTLGLKDFYEQHKQDFMWGERVNAVVFTAADASIAKATQKMLKAKEKKGYTNADILEKMNASSALNLSASEDVFSRDDNEYVDQVPWEKGFHTIETEEGKVIIIEISEVLDPQPKLLDEARGLVTSAFQTALENEWLNELRAKYEVKVDDAVLSDIK